MFIGVVATRFEAPDVGGGEGADAPSHAAGLVLGETFFYRLDNVSSVGHGLDAHVAVQQVEPGKVAVVKVGALGGLGDRDEVKAFICGGFLVQPHGEQEAAFRDPPPTRRKMMPPSGLKSSLGIK